MDLPQLRQKWMELEYDSIMSNNPGEFVWNVLKAQASTMNKVDLVESVADALDCDPEELK